jgi:hypothetical protein
VALSTFGDGPPPFAFVDTVRCMKHAVRLASVVVIVGAVAGAAPAGSQSRQSGTPVASGVSALVPTTIQPGTDDYVPRGVPARALEDVGLRLAAPESTAGAVPVAVAVTVAERELGGGPLREAVLADVTLDGVADVGGQCWVVSITPDDLWSNGVPAVFGSPGALPQKETWAFAIVDAATGAFERGMSGN